MSIGWIAAIIGTLLVAVLIVYRKVVRPLRTIANGVELLRAQDFSSRLAPVGQREADRIVDMFNGMMTSLKQERLRLREQNHFLDLLIEVSPMGIIMLDRDGKITESNRAAAQFLGFESGKALKGVSIGEISSSLGLVLASLKEREVKVTRLNDSMVYRCSRLSFMESGMSHPFYLIEKLTDEVRKAERKAYEQVIRMMAHEVNNSLAGIITVMETAAEEVSDPELSDAIASCEQRSRYMGDFITKFAKAVKIPEPNRQIIDLTDLIRSLGVSLESICHVFGASLELRLPAAEVNIYADPVLLEQVVTNIVKNAAESAATGGKVAISIESAGHLKPTPDKTASSKKPTLTVSDNGPGISKETAEMLFTPFFTTKDSGHGLGLLLVSEVLNSHCFKFSLATESDGLTRFRIQF